MGNGVPARSAPTNARSVSRTVGTSRSTGSSVRSRPRSRWATPWTWSPTSCPRSPASSMKPLRPSVVREPDTVPCTGASRIRKSRLNESSVSRVKRRSTMPHTSPTSMAAQMVEEVEAVHPRVQGDAASGLGAPVEPRQDRRLEALAEAHRLERGDLGQVRAQGADDAVESQGVRHHAGETALGHEVANAPRLGQARRERLLEEQRLARAHGGLDDGHVERRRHGASPRRRSPGRRSAGGSRRSTRTRTRPPRARLPRGRAGRARPASPPARPPRCGGRSAPRACRLR